MSTQLNRHYTKPTHLGMSGGAVSVRPAHNGVKHERRVWSDLRRLGVSRFGMVTMEARYLPSLIHPDEALGGVVYGFHEDGFVMLVGTDRRIIFLDKKPLFVNQDEISYFVVSGVSHNHIGWGATVTLHTRIRDYTIHTFNRSCAERFAAFIEERCLANYQTVGQRDYRQ